MEPSPDNGRWSKVWAEPLVTLAPAVPQHPQGQPGINSVWGGDPQGKGPCGALLGLPLKLGRMCFLLLGVKLQVGQVTGP